MARRPVAGTATPNRPLPSYGQGITYWALGEVLKEHFDILETDSPETAAHRLGEQRAILGLSLGLFPEEDLHPLVARERLHDAWVDFLDELVSERPSVVLIEDLHWAEHDLFDLLESLVGHVTGPLLLLATARPELLDRRPGWSAARPNASQLRLEVLSSRDTAQLLNEVIRAELPDSLRAVLVERAEGNPFFVEELISTLIDTGVLQRQEDGWSIRERPDDFQVPDSVQAVLSARIDLLPPAEKTALQAASVIGRVFWTAPVYELAEGVLPDLGVLEERDFIRRRSGSSIAGEREYVIKHALTREVAYASLPKARRAHLHAAFAAWLERTGGRRAEHASLLAHHYAEAVRPEDADLAWIGAEDELERLREKAVAWLRRAAGLAAGRYEIGEALLLLDQALVRESDDQAKIDILCAVGEVHVLKYDLEGFRRAMETALALRPNRQVAAGIYAKLALYGRGRAYMWKEPPPVELGEHWLTTALELAEPRTEARAEALIARALATPEAGSEAAAQGLALAEELATPRLIVLACEAQVLVASTAGRFEEACDWADRALEALPLVSDPGVRMHQHWFASFVYLRGGRIADVAPLADECDRLAAQLTPHEEVHAVALRALLYSVKGRWRELAELTARAEKAAEANRETPCQFNWRSLVVCALGLEHIGEVAEARRLEESARESSVVAGPLEREPALLRIALLRGDVNEAGRILERLPTSIDPWGLDAAAARLDALTALGNRDRVEEEAATFLDGNSYTSPFALRALGRARGDRRLIEQALTRFEGMGLEWQAAETRALDELG